MRQVQVVPDHVTPPAYKQGDIVRVFRDPLQHGVRFGALMMVQRSGLLPSEGWAEEVELVPLSDSRGSSDEPGPIEEDWNQVSQAVNVAYVKLAKQAMRKQAAYAARRG